jgi:hypothetical protein
MNTKLSRADGVIIWDATARVRWWHRVIWWKRPRVIHLRAVNPDVHGGLTLTWDARGVATPGAGEKR